VESDQGSRYPGWDPGKALEYLLIRAFELDGAQVRWPYSVPLFGEEVEQIDGSVCVNGLYGLVESKDETENVAIGAIAKMRNQLLRRPAGTIGLLFSSSGFTTPAIQLAYFTLPQAILLWSKDEIDYAIREKMIAQLVELKYRECVDSGVPDFDVSK
jgi:hypothetical protein